MHPDGSLGISSCHASTSEFAFVSTLGDWYFRNHSNLHCRSSIRSHTRRLRGESSIGHYGYYRYKGFDSDHRECEEGIFGTGVYFRVVRVPCLLLDLMHPDGSLGISSCLASTSKFAFISTLGDWYFRNHLNLHCRSSIQSHTRRLRGESCIGHYGYYHYKGFDSDHCECKEGIFGTGVYFWVVRVPCLLLDLIHPNGSLRISSCHASAIKFTFPVRSRSCVGTEVYFGVVRVPHLLLDLMHPDGSLRISSCHTSAIKLTFPVRSRSCVGTEVYFRVVWVPHILLDLMHPDGSLRISSCHASAIKLTFPVSRSCVGIKVYFRVVWVPCLLLDLMHPDGSLRISSCHASAIKFTFPVSRSCIGTEVYFRVVQVPCLLLDLMHPDGSLGISSCHTSAIKFTFPVSRSCVILFHCDLLLDKHKRKIFG